MTEPRPATPTPLDLRAEIRSEIQNAVNPGAWKGRDPENIAGGRRGLGQNQIAMLFALHAHGGFWHEGCNWTLGNRSTTLKILDTLEQRGLVRTAGRFKNAPFLWMLAPDVTVAIRDALS